MRSTKTRFAVVAAIAASTSIAGIGSGADRVPKLDSTQDLDLVSAQAEW